MDEDKIIKQIIASNTNFHPNIANSDLDLDDKLTLQFLLETDFNNDFKALVKDMMAYAVEEEHYELAAVIRDFLNK